MHEETHIIIFIVLSLAQLIQCCMKISKTKFRWGESACSLARFFFKFLFLLKVCMITVEHKQNMFIVIVCGHKRAW